jgi:hypothetical protein
MTQLGGPDERRGHPRPAEQPGQGDPGRRHLALGRDRADRVGHVEVGGAVPAVGPGARRVPCAAPVPDPGQQAAGQRTIRQDADALVEAEGDHLPLLLPVDQVVPVLHGHEPGPADRAGGVLCLGEPPGGHGRSPDVPGLARPHHVLQRGHGLLGRAPAVPAVDLVEIDVIGTEPGQRGVDRGQHVLAG